MNDQDSTTVILDSCRYIFLTKLESDDSFTLKIHIAEDRIQNVPSVTGTENNNLDKILKKARPVKIRKNCNAFKIVFKDYNSFSVRNESYVVPENNEDPSRRLRVNQHSNFLKFISDSTWLSSDDMKSLVHYTVICTDHIIDIAASSEPVIEHYLVNDDTQ